MLNIFHGGGEDGGPKKPFYLFTHSMKILMYEIVFIKRSS